jgi:hypothetical protein
VQLDITLEAPCAPGQLFPWVANLDRYQQWLTIVDQVEVDGVGWFVELKGKLGPFARSKRLRMERTVLQPDAQAVFERRETDGRTHALWKLEATVAQVPAGSKLAVTLRYDGTLWGSVVERLLQDEIESAKARLLALVTS